MYPTNTPDTTGSSTPSPNRRARSGLGWTDDLPECQLSDVGFAPNVVYLADGRTTEAYPYEDRAFNFATDYDCYLYGIFDGYDGYKAAHFASERLAAELLLGQLTPHVSESSAKMILHQAFGVVERGFFESIDNILAKKTHLQAQLPESFSFDLVAKNYPQVAQQLRTLNDAIKGGTTAVVALVVNNNLYVANVGDSRALLCQMDHQGKLDVQQITVNHDINNPKELERLSQLGLNIDRIMERGKLGINECTRCIGDYAVKGGYKENEILRDAVSEPVISTPDVFGPIPLSEIRSGFLVLMSDDVYKSYEQATGTSNANADIASMLSHQLRCRNSMEGVAQSVIDKIAFLHQRGFGKSHTFSRGDITLVVRNISHVLGAEALPDIQDNLPDMCGKHPVSVPYKRSSVEVSSGFRGDLGKSPVSLSLKMPGSNPDSSEYTDSNELKEESGSPDATPTNPSEELSTYNSSEKASTLNDHFYRPDPHEQIQLDSDNRVTAYVNFANFDEETWLALRTEKKLTIQ